MKIIDIIELNNSNLIYRIGDEVRIRNYKKSFYGWRATIKEIRFEEEIGVIYTCAISHCWRDYLAKEIEFISRPKLF